MIDRKEIDLLVRAQLKGKQDLEGVTRSIADLQKAIESQADAAKRGEASIDSLKATLLALQQVQERLKGQADLVGTFQRLSEQIGKTGERVSATAKNYEDYKTKLAGLAEVTDKQQDRLVKLSVAAERAQGAFDKQQGRLAEMGAALREAGIATDDLAGAELRVRDAAAQIGVSIAQVQGHIEGYAANVKAARDALREKEQVEKEAIRTTEQFAAAEKRAADAERQRAEDAALVAQIVANRQARAAAAGNEFDNLATEKKRAAELAAMRSDAIAAFEEMDRREKELARNKGLSEQAAEAERAAKSYTSLARAADDLRPKTVSLKDAIAGILDPAKQARSTIEGVEAQVAKLAASIGTLSGPVRDYQGQMRALADTAKSISGQASLIDDFQKQAAALREARAEFSTARAKVAEYAAEVRKGGDDGEHFTKALAEAQGAAARAASALQAQLAATRASRESLRSAGISTNNLTGAQQRLTAAARGTVTATEQLSGAVRKYGNEVEGAGRKHKSFEDGGRTTLSLMQRIRGEVLALTASYVGLQGVVKLAGDAVEASSKRESVKNQLALSVGTDKAAIDAEYAYVKGQSDRIKLEFAAVADSFVKFSSAASRAGQGKEQIRFIFEAFSEIGRVSNMSGEEMGRMFKALEQMLSKGKIMSEEVKGQLADVLPGAFGIFQEALKKEFPDLGKAMEKGLVGAENLVLVAQKVRDVAAPSLAAAIESTRAKQADLNNAIFDFKTAIADSGWLDAYTKLIQQLTTVLRSEDGKKMAEGIAAGFSKVGEVLTWVMQNLDQLKVLLEVVTVLFFTKFLAGMSVRALDVSKDISALSGSFKVLMSNAEAAYARMVGGIGNLNAARRSQVAGTTAAATAETALATTAVKAVEKQSLLRLALVSVSGALGTIIPLIGVGAAAWAFFADKGTAAARSITEELERGREVLARYKKELKFGVGDEGQLRASLDAIDQKISTLVQSSGRSPEAAKQLAALRKEAEELQNTLDDMERRKKESTGQTPFPGVPPKSGAASGPSESDIAKRQRAIDEVTRALETLDAKIDRSQTDSLAKQLAAVDLQYAELKRKIEAIGGEAGAAFVKRLTESTAQLKLQITAKFDADLLKDHEALLNKLEDMEAATGKKSQLSLEERQAGIRKGYEDTYRKIAEFRAKLEANALDTAPADNAKKRLDDGIDELQSLDRIKFGEEQINRLIDLREKKVDAIHVKEALGHMDDVQAAQEVNRINEEAVPAIQAAADATIVWAQAHAAIFGNPEQMQLFIDKIIAIRDGAAQVPPQFDAITKKVVDLGVAAVDTGLNAIVNGLQAIATKQKSVSEGFREIGVAFLRMAADFLREIAVMIIKMMIFRALQSMGGIPGAIGKAGLASMGVRHDGGLVGGPPTRTRKMSATWFANAPRYHSGGIPGLRPDEYATILQRNEEVLAADSPRNILNGGAGLKQPGQAPAAGNRFILVDDRAKIADHMRSAEGENVFIEFLERNASTVRSIVGAA